MVTIFYFGTGNEMSKKVIELAKSEGCNVVLVSAQVESELTGLSKDERSEFLESLGVTDEQCGLKVFFMTIISYIVYINNMYNNCLK